MSRETTMAHLKGNLGLKSSSLAPTSCKLSTQYLVLDHMTNHYNKISQAKAAIDNRLPKSISTSQKMRDRRTRQRVTSPHRTRPLSSLSQTRGHGSDEDDVEEYQDLLDEEPDDEEGRLVQSIMKSTLSKKNSGSNNATYNSRAQTFSQSSESAMRQENGYSVGGEHQRVTMQRPLSARSARSVTSSINGTSRVPMNTHDPKRITYNGDVLDKRAFCFTEPDRPFTPRTLKSNHQSRLKSSKCYNPPKPQSRQQIMVESSSVPEQGKERASRPRPHPRPQPRQRNRSGQSDQFGETMPTNQLSESMLMDITLQSRDGRHSEAPKRDIPPLAISMDTDHFKWLQEQASKAQVRARHSSKLKTSMRPDADIDGQEKDAEESQLNLSQSIRLETLKKEEEQKYLAFAKEVTDDVLTRGISTDKVLKKVFENHIDRRKGDLDEDRMRAVIKDLKQDLGLREESIERKASHSVNFNDMEKKRATMEISKEQDGQSLHSESRDTISSKPELMNGMTTSNGEMTMTMESTSTMKFGQTGDMFSTIHSEQDRELSEGEVEMSGKETDKENENELTATQVLKEYQMNLTAKEASGDVNGEVSSSDVGNIGEDSLKQGAPDASESSGRPATGERRIEHDSSTENNWTITESTLTTNGVSSTENIHSNNINGRYSSTINGTSRSRLRNKRRDRKGKSSVVSGDSSSAREEESSNSVLKSNASMETGSEMDASENDGENYSKPAPKPRGKAVLKASDSEEMKESEQESVGRNEEREKSTGRSVSNAIVEDDYSGDYEDDYDDSQGGDTHRTSDDDF